MYWCSSKRFFGAAHGRAAKPCNALQAKVHWEALLVVLPCFSGYAALFGLQHEVKVAAEPCGKCRSCHVVSASQARFRIADDSSDASHSFGAAVWASQ